MNVFKCIEYLRRKGKLFHTKEAWSALWDLGEREGGERERQSERRLETDGRTN